MRLKDAAALRLAWLLSPNKAALERLPKGLLDAWREQAAPATPARALEASYFAQAADGLMDFFRCCARVSPAPCALPSAAADSVWSAWHRLDPDGLRAFSLSFFGRDLSEPEPPAADASLARALAACWAGACALEGIDPSQDEIPRLFLLDFDLKAPGGYAYLNGPSGGARHALISPEGELLEPWVEHPELRAPTLQAWGWLDRACARPTIDRSQACQARALSRSTNDG